MNFLRFAIYRWLAVAGSVVFASLAQAFPDFSPVPLTYFGLHIHRAEAGSPWPPFKFGSWRLWDAYVAWPNLEPEKEVWDFERLDKDVALAELQGVDILLPLGLSPGWASAHPSEKSGYKSGNAAEPRNIEDWRYYVRTVAERYKGRVRYYEIWNEPNVLTFYTGSIEALVRLTREAYLILKSVDASNILVSPAVVGGGSNNLAYLDEFLSRGGKDYIDIVGYHFYVPSSTPEAMVPIIRAVKKIMQKHGVANKPLWNTETGWRIENGDGTSDHPMHKQWKKLGVAEEAGAYLARAYIIGRAEGLDRFYWYSWDNLYGLGMREPTTGHPKPMAETYGKVVEWLVGNQVGECDDNAGVWACSVYHNNKQIGWVAWRSQGETQFWTKPTTWGAKRVKQLFEEGSSTIPEQGVFLGRSPVLISF